MKFQSIAIGVLLSLFLASSCVTKPSVNNVTFVTQDTAKKVDVLIDGKLFTSYCWYDNVFKPILYPVCTSEGTFVTRGFPLAPREGERVDHRHQMGIWLNYGNVNGNDFWGNGYSGKKSHNGGEVVHMGIEKTVDGSGEGVMSVKANWIDSLGIELISEKTDYHFIAKDSIRIIDRITTLTAIADTVFMNDTKEGMFAIRVTRQLELPSDEDIVLTNAEGIPTTVPAMTNEGVTGNYLSSEGKEGAEVWGTSAKWMDLYGNIGEEQVSLVICDHPKNLNYPTYWHARGYGLFSANPLGVRDFTRGAEELNFKLAKGDSVTFRYRVIVNSGSHLSADEINVLSDEFAEKY